ncbi:Uncharacterised protein [Porphyromonas macacae]|uniref:Uncharacterized protein n=1 Tax=Porphyromonas macacae TaxID=28115 RepID=A0A379EBE0_9PORP|nr:Uncharacterised protein [Porphyromonas macacae]
MSWSTASLAVYRTLYNRYRDYWAILYLPPGFRDDSNRPYIVLSPLKTAEEWKSGAEQAFENRKFFESMVHPQIRIRRGSRIFFQSDVPFKKPGDEQIKRKSLSEIGDGTIYSFLIERSTIRYSGATMVSDRVIQVPKRDFRLDPALVMMTRLLFSILNAKAISLWLSLFQSTTHCFRNSISRANIFSLKENLRAI